MSLVGWAPALIATGIIVVLVCALIVFWPRNTHLRISNHEINAHRITPKFTVGSDTK